jgi:ABC-2 type transport system permease protein
MTAASHAIPQLPTERSAPPLGGFNVTFLALEVRRALRNRRTLVFMLVFPIVIYLLFGKGSGTIGDGSSVTIKQYEMVSLALYGAMTACTSGGSQVAVERALGWSRQLRLTPLRPPAYVAIKIMAAMALGLIPVLVMFAFGAIRGVRLPAHVWILCALAVWLGSLVFATLGLFMGYLLPSENVMQYLGPILGVLSVFGGVFFPITFLSHGLQQIAEITPVYGVADLARSPLLGNFHWSSVVNIVAWTAIFATGSMLVFRRDTKRV